MTSVGMFLCKVTWGAHELIVAARNLLGAALKDVLNRKFILLSESGLPLYPPHTTYLQLMHEDKSRLDSCGMGVGFFHPYLVLSYGMQTCMHSHLHAWQQSYTEEEYTLDSCGVGCLLLCRKSSQLFQLPQEVMLCLIACLCLSRGQTLGALECVWATSCGGTGARAASGLH